MAKSKSKLKSKKMLDEDEIETGDAVEEEAPVEMDDAVEEESLTETEDDVVEEEAAEVDVEAETTEFNRDDLNIDFDDGESPDADVEAETTEFNQDDLNIDFDDGESPDADVALDEDEDTKAARSDGEIISEDDIDALKVGGDEEDDDEDSLDEPRPEPTPKISKLALCLIILNWIAAPLFLTCAFMDHTARAKTSYLALQNHVGIWGLPLKQEEDAASLYEQTRPVYRLSPDQLKTEFQRRPGAERGAASDGFNPVEEPVPLRLRPSDMTDDFKRDLFGSTPFVATLEEEIERLKNSLPDLIKTKADDVLKEQKTADDKRDVVRKTLLRMAWDVKQVEKLDKRLAESEGAKLDALVLDAVQRRMYYDLLAPYNIFRPDEFTDPKTYKIEKISDLDRGLEAIKDYFVERLDSVSADQFDEVHLGKIWAEHKVTLGKDENDKPIHSLQRDSVEKRHTIGFMMFAIAQVSVPTLKEKLVVKGLERANTVCGFHEFANASINYVLAMRFLEERQIAAVKADRQGYIVAIKDNPGMTRSDGFIDDYERDVDRLVKLAEQIDTAKTQLEDFKMQRDSAQQTYVVRAQQHAGALKKLIKSRQTTQQTAEDLREKQQQLHEALIELSDAGTRNFVLEAELRAIETRFMNAQKKEKKKR